LPFGDQSFDLYTISFGLRNVSDRAAALAEAWRVLRFGGRFFCLEFSHPTIPAFGRLYDAYSFHLIPALGEWITHDRASYDYLVESIRVFPNAGQLSSELKNAGFDQVRSWRLSGGIVAIHEGWKL
jgi:demethylmenaquinone methyltransferase/2-methoxy-6-polyprenyl-1,4-benzoquinol methylase